MNRILVNIFTFGAAVCVGLGIYLAMPERRTGDAPAEGGREQKTDATVVERPVERASLDSSAEIAFKTAAEYREAFAAALRAHADLSRQEREARCNAIMEAWVRDFPETALRHIMDNPDYPQPYFASDAVIAYEAAIQADAEGVWLRSLEVSRERRNSYLMSYYIEAMGELNPSAAVSMLDDLPHGRLFQRARWMMGKVAVRSGSEEMVDFLNNVAPHDLNAVFQGVEFELRSSRSRRDGKLSPEVEAIVRAMLAGLENERKKEMLAAKFPHLVPDDPEAEARSLAERERKQQLAEARREVKDRVAEASPEELRSLLAGGNAYTDDELLRRTLVYQAFGKDRYGAMKAMVDAFQSENPIYLKSDVAYGFKRWIDRDSHEFANAVVQLENPELRDIGAELLARTLNWALEYENALEWVDIISSESLRQKLTFAITKKRISGSRSGLGNVEGYEIAMAAPVEGEMKEELVIFGRFESIVGLREEGRFDEAFELVEEIPDEVEREKWISETKVRQVVLLIGENKVEEALAVTSSLPDAGESERVLLHVLNSAGANLVNAGDFDGARAIADHFEDETKREQYLISIERYIQSHGPR